MSTTQTATGLTERRKDDRAKLARQVTELAERHGIGTQMHPEQDGTRQTSVILSGPHGLTLTVNFNGNTPHRPDYDTYVLSWHGVETGWRLQAGAFRSVNTFHGHKATDVVRGTGTLLALLECRFTAIADGSAFEQQN